MKRLLVGLMLLPSLAFAQTAPVKITGKTATLSWDAVTSLNDGSPIPADTSVVYRAYVGTTSKAYDAGKLVYTTSTSFSFADYGRRYFAAKAIIYNGIASKQLESDYSTELVVDFVAPVPPAAPVLRIK